MSCSVCISAGATHQIVQDYLLYYGYGDTLQAFDQAAGLTDGLTDPVASTSGRYVLLHIPGRQSGFVHLLCSAS